MIVALVNFFTSVPGALMSTSGNLVVLFSSLLIIFLLMFILPIFLWWRLNTRIQQRSHKVLQLLLRAHAGPDEPLIRELEAIRHQRAEQSSKKENFP